MSIRTLPQPTDAWQAEIFWRSLLKSERYNSVLGSEQETGGLRRLLPGSATIDKLQGT